MVVDAFSLLPLIILTFYVYIQLLSYIFLELPSLNHALDE